MDLELARWIADHRISPLTRVFHGMEAVGESFVSFAIAGLVGLLVVARLRLWWGLPRIALAVGLMAVISGDLKERIDRPRPPAELAVSHLSGPGMPSSHACLTSVVVTAVLLTPWWTSARLRRIAVLLGVGGCLIVGVAMIYLGGHWLSDVLVGWAVGVGLAVLAVSVRPQRRRVQPA